MDPGGGRGGTARHGLRAAWPPTSNITLPEETQSPVERWWLLKTLTWRSHWHWDWRSPASSEGWLRTQKKKKRHPLPNPQWKSSISGWLGKLKLVKHLASRESCWQHQRCKDCKELAWKVQASFHLPKWASELNRMENYHQAPPAPPCLLRRNFLPPPNCIFACWDIWEMQREKMVAYAQALQYWVEKTDLPTGGKPCLLAESVKELWEEMRCYLSFLDKEVFEVLSPWRRCLPVQLRRQSPTAWQPCLPLCLRCKLPPRQLGNQLWRGSPLSSPVGRKYCTHPNLWWLWGRYPTCQEVQGRGFMIGRQWPPFQKPPPYTRIGSHLAGNANSQFSGSDGMFKKSIARGGPCSIPGPIGGGVDVSSWGGDHVY